MKYIKTYENHKDKTEIWFDRIEDGLPISNMIYDGFDPDTCNEHGMTGLMLVCTYHHYTILMELILGGADINYTRPKPSSEETALDFLIIYDKNTIKIMALLIEYGATINPVFIEENKDMIEMELEVQDFIMEYQPDALSLLIKNDIDIKPEIKEKYPELMDSTELGLL